MFRFQFGMTLQDRVTGCRGIVTGISGTIAGLRQYGLSRGDGKGGAEVDWFEEDRLEQVESGQLFLDQVGKSDANSLSGSVGQAMAATNQMAPAPRSTSDVVDDAVRDYYGNRERVELLERQLVDARNDLDQSAKILARDVAPQ